MVGPDEIDLLGDVNVGSIPGVRLYQDWSGKGGGIELYDEGILTDKDMPDFPSESEERFYWLLDRIVRREGIGDVLAEIGEDHVGPGAFDGRQCFQHHFLTVDPAHFLRGLSHGKFTADIVGPTTAAVFDAPTAIFSEGFVGTCLASGYLVIGNDFLLQGIITHI